MEGMQFFPDEKLINKVEEQTSLFSRQDAEEMDLTSSATAKFVCQNTTNPDEVAWMSVHMQLPYKESVFLSTAKRASEVSSKISEGMQFNFDARKLLHDHGCTSAPALLGYSHQMQPADGIVPRGYLFYLATSKVPGIPLGTGTNSVTSQGLCQSDGVFWQLPRKDRDRIRAAFEVAYRFVLN
ncbi:uncharacterized protein KD926_009752 [Aspergillus affinis]|uniref:uncharacterized protein n=1 Tax=Aspergillus affinis TaxID=1070780 RepID=UPI0022FEA61F|nr:uncharacterized protein KD926_009752 [Aspergillus affinis]KAI9039310.1 hypothetical protein KD926_009752 [Aspergillus affinis]